jgi:hypothetical protein
MVTAVRWIPFDNRGELIEYCYAKQEKLDDPAFRKEIEGKYTK